VSGKNAKAQVPSFREIPNFKSQKTCSALREIWNFSGIWSLELPLLLVREKAAEYS
jgi:hypothetical protein